ncbi:MAG TPA: S8/S53 family peptidase, partial [Phycisphaerae bacterium]|nr:S8/S53 family peptidase [Phycisphaerae bacterium]
LSGEATEGPRAAGLVRAAAREGRIVRRRTTLDELKALLGPPTQEVSAQEGWQGRIRLTYPDVEAVFVRDWGRTTPPILLYVTVGDHGVEWPDRLVVLRDRQDLERLDSFLGVESMSLAALDLRNEAEELARLPFNTDTQWPDASRLPPGFDPQALLEQGKNPGLGVHGLHARGLDGRGIGLAIIDQPLVRDHCEYVDRMARYEELDVEGVPPQMHGPAVASIAVGKTCGVAPRAALHYYAMPMWSWRSCGPYREVIESILAHNRGATDDQRPRVVSISLGMFSQWEGYAEWRQTLAEAAAQGVLVVTCDRDWLQYGTLQRKESADPDDPTGYVRGRYGGSHNALYVPAGNRTIAGPEGPQAYTYDRTGGMSWAAPYLAGLAALAFQANPELHPTTIVRLWQETATKTDVGPIINPTAFLAAVRTAQASAGAGRVDEQ